jgi:hypothetical protein
MYSSRPYWTQSHLFFGFVIFPVFHDPQRLNLLHQLFLFCLVCPVVGFGWIMFGTSLRIGSFGCGSPVLFQRIGALVLAVFAALIVGRILSAPWNQTSAHPSARQGQADAVSAVYGPRRPDFVQFVASATFFFISTVSAFFSDIDLPLALVTFWDCRSSSRERVGGKASRLRQSSCRSPANSRDGVWDKDLLDLVETAHLTFKGAADGE